MKILAALVLAAGLSAQNAPLNLIPAPNMSTWPHTHMLEAPVITKTASTFAMFNPSFNRGSYVTVTTQAFPVLPKLGDEPDARLAIDALMNATNNVGVDTVTWRVKDAATGATFATRNGDTNDERVSFGSAIPPQHPYPPISSVRVQFVVKLRPRMTWTLTGFKAWRSLGPTVRYFAGEKHVDVQIDASSYGGNQWGVAWSASPINRLPIPGFQGAGLLGTADVILFVPLQPIISHNTALIAALRAGRWQALETNPAPAIGWPVGN